MRRDEDGREPAFKPIQLAAKCVMDVLDVALSDQTNRAEASKHAVGYHPN
jgi:hypothetical protein